MQAPGKISIFARTSPAVAQGRPAARDGRTPASKRLGWGLDSPSRDWRGWLGGKRLRRRSAAREAAVGRGGRNAGVQASRPANARARERSRGVGGGFRGARTRVGATNQGAHRRAPAGGNGSRGRRL
jgi:hypothetical protein